MVIWLERGADLHVAHLMPLPLTVSCFSKIQTGFWYWLTRVVPDKGLLNGCVCVTITTLWYGDSVDNTVAEKSSICIPTEALTFIVKLS